MAPGTPTRSGHASRRLSPPQTPNLPFKATIDVVRPPSPAPSASSQLSHEDECADAQSHHVHSRVQSRDVGAKLRLGKTDHGDDEGSSLADDDFDEGAEGPSDESSGSRQRSFDTDEHEEFDVEDDEDEEADVSVTDPLTSRGRRRRRWEPEEKQERGVYEIIPNLILAHPLPLLPLLCLLPYNFLPAGVVLFVPFFCILAALSTCAHIVIVYLAWYLKVRSFEDVFAACAAKHGKYGLWGGRVFVVASTMGLVVGWLGTLHPLLQPLVDSYLPHNDFFASRVVWTILASTLLLPSLTPSRTLRHLRAAPIFLALAIPVIAFLVIGRIVELRKAAEAAAEEADVAGVVAELADDATEAVKAVVSEGVEVVKRKLSLSAHSSGGAGLTTLVIFLTPHLNTLPIHSTMNRNKRSAFPIPCLATSLCLLLLCLPFALVPYYLLPDPTSETTTTPTTRSGVFGVLPAADGWLNLARVLQCAMALGSINMWLLRGRDTVLGCLGIERGDRIRAGRWVGIGLWAIAVLFACIGGFVADKVETIGIIATLAVGWLLPAVFFIITFHVRSPLSIIFPSNQANSPHQSSSSPAFPPLMAPRTLIRPTHSRVNSLQDPSVDALLARKERQLQRRRLERRLWQDLIVWVGILPVGVVTIAWSVGSLLGVW
ncbi:hypothetical protein Q5752_005268 [Cryptotrichosporon argae]